MKSKIAILIPTRERLDDFKIFAQSWKETTEGFSDVIVRIDNDDKTYEEIKNEYPEFIYVYGERKPFLDILNDLAIEYSTQYKYIGFMEDDCNFNTPKWETRFIQKLDEFGLGIVWADDKVNGDSLVGLPFLTSNIVQKLGFLCPSEIKYLWADHFWKAMSIYIGKSHYFNDIVIEHRHYSTGKRQKDVISETVDKGGDLDFHAYNNYRINKLWDDLNKLNS